MFVCAGVNHEELCSLAESKFTRLPATPNPVPTLSPCRYTGSDMRARDDDMPFAHVAFAVEVGGWVELRAVGVVTSDMAG